MFFYKKSMNKEIQQYLKFLSFSFDELCVDLNLYLGSNDDLRRSTVMKKNLYLEESLNCLIKSFNKEDKSKFLPFNKNFLLQILFNNKISHQLKLNYMNLMIVLFDEVEISNLNFFEIILKILINYGDEIYKKKAEVVFVNL